MLRNTVGVTGPHLDGKRAIVVGLGASGRAAVELLESRGASVVATDRCDQSKLPAETLNLPCEYVLGGHEGVDWASADLVVVSPGVPDFSGLQEAVQAGVEVWYGVYVTVYWSHGANCSWRGNAGYK